MEYCSPQNKILWHLDRIVEWQKTGTSNPILFEIDPSNKCNHDCPWCTFAKLRSESKEMICLDALKKLLGDMTGMGVKAVSYSGGGEPLMNPATIEAIKYGKSLGLDQGIFTNGALLTKDKADVMAYAMTWIRVSVDAFGDESYAYSHGTVGKQFDKVIDNVRYLCSLPNRCTVGVGFVIHDKNYQDIYNMAKLAKEIGADYIQLKPMTPPPGQKQFEPDFIKNKVMPEIERARSLGDSKFTVMVSRYKLEDLLSPDKNYGRNYKKCLSHNFQGAVGADSKVYVCDHHKGEKQYEIGDLKESSLPDIWESQRRKDVIKWLDSTDLSQCQVCCRNHELNKFLWHVTNPDKELHPNHI